MCGTSPACTQRTVRCSRSAPARISGSPLRRPGSSSARRTVIPAPWVSKPLFVPLSMSRTLPEACPVPRRGSGRCMDFSVVAVAREDDSPVEEPLRVATVADRLGYREVWAGEGPTWDAFVLAAAIGRSTERVALTAGPIPVSVRDPYTSARGAASVAALVGRPVGVALGTSSKRVVEGMHGRPRVRPAAVLEEQAAAV